MYLHPPSTLPPSSIVDSYRRDSGGSRQDKSTDQQLTEIAAYCQKYNLIHRQKFVDVAKSGGSTAGRDDFNKMLALYEDETQRPDGLLLWNYARFARDIDDAQLNKIIIRRWGIAIHSLNDQVPEGDYGRFVEFFIDMANEEKRKQTSTDAKRGLRDLVQNYGCIPGTPPVGFKRTLVNLGKRRDNSDHIAHRWDPDPDFMLRIRRAFELRAAGISLNEIQKETHLFHSLNSYKTFFANQLYIGILNFGDLTIENYCDPLIDRQTWDIVQRILERTAKHQHLKSETHPRRHAASYLLSGLVRCARCDSPLHGMTSGQRNGHYYYRYACTRATRNRDCEFKPIPARQFEREVIATLHKFVEHPDNLAEIMDAVRNENEQSIAKQQTDAHDLQKQLTSIRRSIANITEAISKRKSSKALLTKLDNLESEELDMQTRLHQAKAQTPKPIPVYTKEKILALSKQLSRVLESKDPSEIRTGLISMTHNIIVDRRENHVYGIVNYKQRPREPESEESPPSSITASLSLAPAGAHR